MTKSNNKNRDAAKSAPLKKKNSNPALEEFIYNASDLLEAFPSALVSISYTVKENQENTGVKFTIRHSGQSKYLTYESFDTKEISRILAFIGPGGVTADSVNSEKKKSDPEEIEKKQDRITGLTSIMNNHDFHSS
ncbi:hypothetical protein METBIDRAFT_10088 [Metschnikowia bicuspidata var. bicuspidata NRRL YB-4993]|uniref:SRP9 domain-containing protein n=1 Tax=Metschnikowia bicuspidata var. bicuspidata NRRL YB-4993 TaxID=869754 RepID=A0A1A0HIP5_9ASCO|nr:hypothetical protein METBIDRAFT_10088 [Metschnikowia bicuspidata var. bicuspidata NRRL YB-4993]OBA23876.1 hypothetical protein METBIDRAFT_10088 [Metschnikowia bicuspidata var. bicuspidata NRRL YB-4993]